MTGTLKVDTAKLRSTASSFQGTGNSMKSTTGQMMTLVSSLTGSVWSGDAATAYTGKFNQLKSDIDRMLKMVNEHVTDLNQMAQGYESAEAENRSSAQALSGSVIV
jgi:WXG100 family type VII secretion target